MARAVQHGIKFDWSINFGHLVMTAAFVVSIFSSVLYVAKTQAASEYSLKAGEEARAKYIPKIDALETAQKITENRFDNVAMALREVRTAIQQQSTTNITLSERLVSLETTLRFVNGVPVVPPPVNSIPQTPLIDGVQ